MKERKSYESEQELGGGDDDDSCLELSQSVSQ
jgi:hypothetical protein